MAKTLEEFRKMLTKKERDKVRQERAKSTREKRYIKLAELFKHRALTTNEVAKELDTNDSAAYSMLSLAERDNVLIRRFEKDTLMAYWAIAKEVKE